MEYNEYYGCRCLWFPNDSLYLSIILRFTLFISSGNIEFKSMSKKRCLFEFLSPVDGTTAKTLKAV